MCYTIFHPDNDWDNKITMKLIESTAIRCCFVYFVLIFVHVISNRPSKQTHMSKIVIWFCDLFSFQFDDSSSRANNRKKNTKYLTKISLLLTSILERTICFDWRIDDFIQLDFIAIDFILFISDERFYSQYWRLTVN